MHKDYDEKDVCTHRKVNLQRQSVRLQSTQPMINYSFANGARTLVPLQHTVARISIHHFARASQASNGAQYQVSLGRASSTESKHPAGSCMRKHRDWLISRNRGDQTNKSFITTYKKDIKYPISECRSPQVLAPWPGD